MVPAETPAQREIDVARIVGDGVQMHRDVMERIPENRPQEPGLHIGRIMQRLHPLDRVLLLQDAHHQVVGLAAAGDVIALCRIEAQDVLTDLLVETGAGLLSQRAGGDQPGQHVRRLVDREERIVGKRVLHRLDDMAHGVETDHVGGAEGARLGAAELGAGQVVDHIA